MTKTCPYCNSISCNGLCQTQDVIKELGEDLNKRLKKYQGCIVDEVIVEKIQK